MRAGIVLLSIMIPGTREERWKSEWNLFFFCFCSESMGFCGSTGLSCVFMLEVMPVWFDVDLVWCVQWVCNRVGGIEDLSHAGSGNDCKELEEGSVSGSTRSVRVILSLSEVTGLKCGH